MDPGIQIERDLNETLDIKETETQYFQYGSWKEISVERQQKAAECAIEITYFEALVFTLKDSDENSFTPSGYPQASTSLFPSVTSIIKTGSRAEQLYLDGSDKDDIYEVGPRTVQIEKSETPNNRDFYCIQSEFPGFYIIHDDKDAVLYPKSVQAKLAPLVTYSNNEKSGTIPGLGRLLLGNSNETYMKKLVKESTSPAVKSDGDDFVIAMRLAKWPNGLSLEGKLSWIRSDEVKNIQDCPLYLVPKSHPRSKFPEIEWRLSYSIVEKKVMLALPYLYRKAYLISKDLLKRVMEWYEISFSKINIESFHLKTILLHYLDREEKATNLYDTVQQLLTGLLNAYKDKKLLNYFINEINLLDSSENYEECEKVLEWIIKNLNLLILVTYDFKVKPRSSMHMYPGIINFHNLFANNDHDKISDPSLMLAVILLDLYSRLVMHYFTGLNNESTTKTFETNKCFYIIAVMQLLVTGYKPAEKITMQNFSQSFCFKWEIPQHMLMRILDIANKFPEDEKFCMQWNKLKEECEKFSVNMKKSFDMKVCVDIIKSKEREIQSLSDIYHLGFFNTSPDIKDHFNDSNGNINPFQIIEKSPLEDAVVCLDKSLKKFFPGETQNA